MNDVESILVSVVIPTYNHAGYLGRALQSLLDQTYTHWEAIVIDNHSTDNTDEVIARFSDPRITYLKIHNNGVIAASRNEGIRAAKGVWIAFLDSDDCWFPHRLEIVINMIKRDPSLDVLCSNEIQIDLTNRRSRLLEYGPFCSNFYKSLLIEGNRISTSATLVKHNFLSDRCLLFREDPKLVTVEDYDFWMLIAKAGAKFHFIPSALGEATIHSNNSSGQAERHWQSLINLINDHVYNIQDFQPNKEKLWNTLYAQVLISNLKIQIGGKRYIAALKTLKLAFQISVGSTIKYCTKKLFKKSNRSAWKEL